MVFIKSQQFQLYNLNPSDLNNTKKAETDILFFNRVPKVGSVQMINLLKTLGKTHNYDVFTDGNMNGGILRTMTKERQEIEVERVLNRDDPGVFVSHMNWIDFSEFDEPKPIYINMVRDPVERVISWFYYIRSPWIFVPQRRLRKQKMPDAKWMNTEFDECVERKHQFCQYTQGAGFGLSDTDHRRQTLFFCGHNQTECEAFNGEGPLQIAKRNVEKEYAVVGTWEDTNITLAVLENYIPKYFKGAPHLYYCNVFYIIAIISILTIFLCTVSLDSDHQNSNPMKPHIKEEIKEMVRKNFTREIEFYQFCKQRLYKQYLAIKLEDIRGKK